MRPVMANHIQRQDQRGQAKKAHAERPAFRFAYKKRTCRKENKSYEGILPVMEQGVSDLGIDPRNSGASYVQDLTWAACLRAYSKNRTVEDMLLKNSIAMAGPEALNGWNLFFADEKPPNLDFLKQGDRKLRDPVPMDKGAQGLLHAN